MLNFTQEWFQNHLSYDARNEVKENDFKFVYCKFPKWRIKEETELEFSELVKGRMIHFSDDVPNFTSFNRFFKRLAENTRLQEDISRMIDLKILLPEHNSQQQDNFLKWLGTYIPSALLIRRTLSTMSSVQFKVEKITGFPDRIVKWRNMARSEQNKWEYKYKVLWASLSDETLDNLKERGFLPTRKGAELTSGYLTFEECLNFSEKGELYVIYAESNNIAEISVCVMTDKDAPMSSHMGVNRSFQYLCEAYIDPEKYPVHRGLAMKLHAFAADFVSKLYPNKLYMISAPVPAMQEIFRKMLPETFVGSSWEMAEASEPVTKLKLLRRAVSSKKAVSKTDEDLQDAELERLEVEIDALTNKISSTVALTEKDPPIRWTKSPWVISILSLDRKTEVFNYSRETGIATSFGVIYSREDSERKFGWFQHSHLFRYSIDNPLICADIRKLARL